MASDSKKKSKLTPEQLKKLNTFIKKEKIKAGGCFKSTPFIGVDKYGKPFKYINEALKNNEE